MPRCIPNDPKKRGDSSRLNCPEAREKAIASIRAGAKKRQIGKLFDKINTVNLEPLEDEIRELQARIAGLTAMRDTILAIRNGKQPAAAESVSKPKTCINGAPVTPEAKKLADEIFVHLKFNAPMTTPKLADYFCAERVEVQEALQHDKRFLFVNNGWSLAD